MLSRSRIFGLNFVSGDIGAVATEVCRLAEERPGVVVTPMNADLVVKFLREPPDQEFRAACLASDLLLPDGMPIVWASRLLSAPLHFRVTGTDLMTALCARATLSAQSVFLLGASPGVAERAAAKLTANFPKLRVVGSYAPPLGFEQLASENLKILDMIRKALPSFLFVAFGAPKQEKWIARWRAELAAGVILAVGGAFDMLAGDRRRAPSWMRDGGLEWLWRLFLEPKRLWRRYLIDDVAFAPCLWREWRRQRKL